MPVREGVAENRRDRRPVRVVERDYPTHWKDTVDAQEVTQHIIKQVAAIDEHELRAYTGPFQVRQRLMRTGVRSTRRTVRARLLDQNARPAPPQSDVWNGSIAMSRP